MRTSSAPTTFADHLDAFSNTERVRKRLQKRLTELLSKILKGACPDDAEFLAILAIPHMHVRGHGPDRHIVRLSCTLKVEGTSHKRHLDRKLYLPIQANEEYFIQEINPVVRQWTDLAKAEVRQVQGRTPSIIGINA